MLAQKNSNIKNKLQMYNKQINAINKENNAVVNIVSTNSQISNINFSKYSQSLVMSVVAVDHAPYWDTRPST